MPLLIKQGYTLVFAMKIYVPVVAVSKSYAMDIFLFMRVIRQN